MITSRDINENGVVAKIFYPETSEPCPAIIVLSGSDGGFYEHAAQSFAQNGYVALALAYFNAEGLPEKLENIPLEYFLNGIEWLKNQPQVESEKIHVYGISRGGELALLLASTFSDQIASVVAVVPSCVTYGGIPNETMPAWTLHGKPLPIAPAPSEADEREQLKTQESVILTTLFLEKKNENKQAFDDAFIKVENIECPILLVSGKDDKMWPSSMYSNLIMQRLDECGSEIVRKHLCYDKAGHLILHAGAPVITQAFEHPVVGLRYEIGGDPEAQALANKDSWEKILNFLSRFSKQ